MDSTPYNTDDESESKNKKYDKFAYWLAFTIQ